MITQWFTALRARIQRRARLRAVRRDRAWLARKGYIDDAPDPKCIVPNTRSRF